MKRLICLTLVVTILFCTASCKKKVYLEPDEYYVYQYGEIVESFNDEGSYEYRFSDIQEERLREGFAETKRGIKIGSSVDEIAKAYKGVGFYFPVVGEPYSKDNYYKRYNKIYRRYKYRYSIYDRDGFYEGLYYPDQKIIIITYLTKVYNQEIRSCDNFIKYHEMTWPDRSYTFTEYEGSQPPFNYKIYSIIIEIDENYKVSDIIIGKVEF